jgi:ABC-type multidrug transport system fused ATPase/permease subunit
MPSTDRSALSKIWELMGARERKMAIPVVALMFLSSLSSVAMVGTVIPFLYVLAHPEIITTDPRLVWLRGLVSDDVHVAFVLGGVAILAILLSALIGMAKVYSVSRYASMRAFSLSTRMLQLQLHQPYINAVSTPLSITSRRVIREPNEAVSGYLMPLGEAFASAITACGMLIFLLWFDPIITVALVLLFGCVYTVIHRVTKPRLIAAGERRIDASTRRGHTFNEAIRCFREVRMSAQEADFHTRFSAATRDETQTRIAVEILSKTPRYIMQAVFFIAVVASAMVLVYSGGLSGANLTAYLPTVGVFMLAGQRTLPEIQNFFGALGRMASGSASVHSVYAAHQELLASALPVVEAQPLPLSVGLELDAVCHVYPDREGGALHGVSLSIPKGQKLGLVGPSGSGKSTLVAVVMGLMPPSSGRVLVDGVALDDNPVGWRLSVAQVPQEVVLVAGSVRANVALGEDPKRADEARVRAALHAARLDTFVEGLPQGLDTDVMTGLASLSGGQRQRLGLARAFYRNADVLVLDEATSALDEATEAAILAEMEAATKDKTVISVAHRLGTLRGCDRIVALDEGRVVFDGDWEEFRAWKASTQG